MWLLYLSTHMTFIKTHIWHVTKHIYIRSKKKIKVNKLYFKILSLKYIRFIQVIIDEIALCVTNCLNKTILKIVLKKICSSSSSHQLDNLDAKNILDVFWILIWKKYVIRFESHTLNFDFFLLLITSVIVSSIILLGLASYIFFSVLWKGSIDFFLH